MAGAQTQDNAAKTVGAQTRITAAEGVLSRSVEKGGVLVDARSGDCFELNETGQLAWLGLTAGSTVEVAAATLVERFTIEPARAQADVVALVEALIARKLIQITP